MLNSKIPYEVTIVKYACDSLHFKNYAKLKGRFDDVIIRQGSELNKIIITSIPDAMKNSSEHNSS